MKFLFGAVILINYLLESNCMSNNRCPTYDDYYTIKDNPKCWYDFTADSNVTEVIRKHGYPIETYKVLTPDGHILTVFRIPNYNAPNEIKKKTPVLLQHGIASTSANFVGKGKDSLAIQLSDSGYDVWLGNFRGTEYSEGHLNYTVFDKEFWDHSMDDIGLVDIPLQIELVAQRTGQRGNIVYIAHSLGTTAGMMYSSTYPEQARKTLKLMVFLAPAATLSNMPSPVRFIVPFADSILKMVMKNDMMRLMSQSEPVKAAIKPICLETPRLMQRCIEMLNVFYGPKSQTGAEMVPIYFNQLPAGTSLKVTRHASELVRNIFRRYDYGHKNIEKYGTLLPPIYDVRKIRVPIFIMYAVNDWVCSKKDSLNLYNNLSPETKIHGIYEISEPNFNHIDFVFGKNVKTLVYDKILELLSTINSS